MLGSGNGGKLKSSEDGVTNIVRDAVDFSLELEIELC